MSTSQTFDRVEDEAFVDGHVAGVGHAPGDRARLRRRRFRDAVKTCIKAWVLGDEHGHLITPLEAFSAEDDGEGRFGVGREGWRKHHITPDDAEFPLGYVTRCFA